MRIEHQFDSGNIEVVDATDPNNVQLNIRRDAGDEHFQWFHFRVCGARGVPCTFRILNANQSSYAPGWNGYQARYSTDRHTWKLADTRFEDGVLEVRLTPEHDVVSLAYFAPYSFERHLDKVGHYAAHPGVRHEVLGSTLDGRSMDLLTFGTPGDGKKVLWVIARQHPGESMAQWWMEGFLDRLVDRDDAAARSLLSKTVVYAVPNMNPDGSVRGHLRCNAAGANLNREWHAPTMERAPEVKLVRDRMDQTGVDLCLDVHGDEELPYNFIAGPDRFEGFDEHKHLALVSRFKAIYTKANSDFQVEHGYPFDDDANMTMCTNAIAQRFDCLAMTLEQPFKDTIETPDPDHGWSPSRCKKLGASVLHPMLQVLDEL